MGKRLLFSGLDSHWAEAIARRFPPPEFTTHPFTSMKRLIPLVSNNAAKVAIVGDMGTEFSLQMDLIRRMRTAAPALPIIMLNCEGSEARAVAALRAGVNDYFSAPLPYAEIWSAISGLFHIRDALRDIPGTQENDPLDHIIGSCSSMRHLKRYLLRVSNTTSTVLVTGETGTGKELVAETIHRRSRRAGKPLVCVNCAAIPDSLVESELFGFQKGAFTGAVTSSKGKFELAAGGTLFLDEIGEMSPLAQAKILRSIETGAVYPLGGHRPVPLDVRIIAATNRDLEDLMARGRFRQDLYYRINVARIHLPPLRERKADIPELVDHCIRKLNRRAERRISSVADDAMTAMVAHQWPGNVRELNNLIESTFITSETSRIRLADLPPTFVRSLTFHRRNAENERDQLMEALAATQWNKSRAARRLNWSRMRIYRALKRHRIQGP
jgi:DNA-binding NtrC family response regulator